ncbi:hypothetical protein Tco_1305350 [Tanacetum coccineum]
MSLGNWNELQSKSLNEGSIGEASMWCQQRWVGTAGSALRLFLCTWFTRPFCRRCGSWAFNWLGRASGCVTVKKLEVSKQSLRLYTLAWDKHHRISERNNSEIICQEVSLIKNELGARRRSDTVLVSTINDADQGSADVAYRTPLAPYEKSKFLGSGGSMVARLKLKEIDGRAPPGVEPAA